MATVLCVRLFLSTSIVFSVVTDGKPDPTDLKIGIFLQKLLAVIDAGDDVQVGGVPREKVPPSVKLCQRREDWKFWRQKICSNRSQISAEDVVDVPQEESKQIPFEQKVKVIKAAWYDLFKMTK